MTMNRPAGTASQGFGTRQQDAAMHWSNPLRPALPIRREFVAAQTDGPRVDAQTAELRERIAAAARATLMGALLHRR
jgi:hypothetical protein